MGIGRLMRMEERIVLDGAVVADAVDSVDAADVADSAHTIDSHDSLEPADDSSTDSADSGDSDYSSSENGGDTHAAYSKALIINDDIDNAEALAAAALNDTLTFVYDGSSDSLQDIIDGFSAVSGNTRFDSIALAAYGQGAGSLLLNDANSVSLASLLLDSDQQSFFHDLGAFLDDDGRLDLLTCELTATDEGGMLRGTIEHLAGHEVAASDDATGNAVAGGDWVLESSGMDVSSVYFDTASLSSFDAILDVAEDKTCLPMSEAVAVNGALFSCSMDYDEDTGYLVVGASDKSVDGYTSGAVYVFFYDSIHNAWAQKAVLTASDSMATTMLGQSVAIEGDTIVAGAYGSAYIFESDNGEWYNSHEAAILTDSGSTSSYGTAVDIMDGVIAVGDTGFNSNYGGILLYEKSISGNALWDGGDADLGAVLSTDAASGAAIGGDFDMVDINADGVADRIYTIAPTAGKILVYEGWALTDSVGNYNHTSYHLSDTSSTIKTGMSASGDWVAVASTTDSTEVDIYEYDGASWSLSGSVYSSVGNVNAFDLNGDLLVYNGANSNGMCSFAEYNGSSWDNIVSNQLISTTSSSGNELGGVVLATDAHIFVGSPTTMEMVNVYDYDGTNWGIYDSTDTYHQNLDFSAVTLEGMEFGLSLDVDGDYAVVSAAGVYDEIDYTNHGAAYVYFWNGINWEYQAKLSVANYPIGSTYTSYFGTGVAIDGDTIAVATQDPTVVYIYDNGGMGWMDMSETAVLTVDSTYTSPTFGNSLSLDDGILAVSDSAYFDGTYYGAVWVWVYDDVSGLWGVDDAAETPPIFRSSSTSFMYDGEAGDTITSFGSDVCIEDGMLAIGMKDSDVAGYADNGGVYVTAYDGASWSAPVILYLEENNAFLGSSVDQSAGLVAAGAQGYDYGGYTDNGAIALFDIARGIDDTAWESGSADLSALLVSSHLDDYQYVGAVVAIGSGRVFSVCSESAASTAGDILEWHYDSENEVWGIDNSLPVNSSNEIFSVSGAISYGFGSSMVYSDGHLLIADIGDNSLGAGAGAYYSFNFHDPLYNGTWVVSTSDDISDPYDGVISLREAVNNAKDGDLVIFDPSLDGSVIYLDHGAINISQSIVISGNGLNITIDGGLDWADVNENGLIDIDEVASVEYGLGDRIFYIHNTDFDIEVIVDHLSLINGNADSANMDSGYGGIIYNFGESLVLNEVFVQAGFASYGGGAVYSDAMLTIAGSSFYGNFSGANGGAVYSSGILEVVNSEFNWNSATNDGGAVYATGSGYVTDYVYLDALHFAGNTASSGGAVVINDMDLYNDNSIVLSGMTFNDNEAKDIYGLGGGALLLNGIYSGNIKLIDVEFAGNYSAAYGGGMSVQEVNSLSLEKTVFSGNSASNAGAMYYGYGSGQFKGVSLVVIGNRGNLISALAFESGDISIGNSLIAANTSDGGGAVNVSGDSNTHVYMYNNTIAGNDDLANGSAVQIGGGVFALLANDLLYHNDSDLSAEAGTNVVVFNSLLEHGIPAQVSDGGSNITSISSSPVVEEVVEGHWNFVPNASTYDPLTGTTKLTTAVVLDVANDALAGLFLIANEDDGRGYLILGNTGNTITILGRVADVHAPTDLQGDFNYIQGYENFEVIDPRLSADSPARDSGDNNRYGVSELRTDLWGDNRIYNGTVDMGAYEFVYTPEPQPDSGNDVPVHVPDNTPSSADTIAATGGDDGGVPADPYSSLVTQILADAFDNDGFGGTGDGGFGLFNEIIGDVAGGDAGAFSDAVEGDGVPEAGGEGEVAPEAGGEGEAGGDAAGPNAANADGGQANGQAGNGNPVNAANRGAGENGAGGSAGPINNFFSDSISNNQIIDSFSSSFDTFSSLSNQGGAVGALANQALGVSATTAALSLRVTSLLGQLSGKLGAGLPLDLDDLAFMEDGGGYTAETGGSLLQRITTRYVSDLVKARGDSLRANEMLRQVAMGLNANADSLSMDVFSGNLRELIVSNERTVIAYEQLNSVLKAAKDIDAKTDAAVIESQLLSVASEAAEATRGKLELLNTRRDRMAEDATVSRIKDMEAAVRSTASDDVAAKRTALKNALQNWGGLDLLSEPVAEIPAFTTSQSDAVVSAELASK